jgi:16S rRNA (cytosine967-C5)-methyltransferase
MAISPARTAAFDILLRVEQEHAYASELLHSARFHNLSSADHALATELVMGTLRWRSWLDQQLEAACAKKLIQLDLEVLIALRMAAYQTLFLARVPARAAVHESVELVKRARKRSAAAFANAVLRKIAGSGNRAEAALQSAHSADSADDLAKLSAHPLWLVERWISTYGIAKTRSICLSDQAPPQAAIRLPNIEAEETLRHLGMEFGPGALLHSARRVVAGNVAQTSACTAGGIAIQDEASQLVACLVGKGKRLLDCCAAPGGKTAVLAERNPDSAIVAVELHPHRARLLRQRVPAANVEVITADATSLPRNGEFDRVLVDVPCSGTGTLAKHPEIKWRLQPRDLADLQARQLAILGSAMSRLAAGGRLVYSTCSLEREENEVVIERALAACPDYRLADCRQVLSELKAEGELTAEVNSLLDGPYLRTLPGLLPCDGFFAAVIERAG